MLPMRECSDDASEGIDRRRRSREIDGGHREVHHGIVGSSLPGSARRAGCSGVLATRQSIEPLARSDGWNACRDHQIGRLPW
jgi:hypothetical protein